VPIDPNLGQQGPREIHHRCGFGDHDRLACDAPAPVALPTVMPCDIMSGRFPLPQLVLRDDRRLCGPLIGAIPLHLPLGEALDHRLQGRLVTLTTCPVQELTGLRISGLPDPQLPSRVLEVVPHLVQLQDERIARGLRLLTDWAETRWRHARRCLERPLRDQSPAWTFLASGFPRGVVRVN